MKKFVLLSLFLLLIFANIICSAGGLTPQIYADNTLLSSVKAGAIHAEVEAQGDTAAVICLYEGAAIKDMSVAGGSSGTVKTGTVEVSEVTADTVIKVCVLNNGTAEVFTFTAQEEESIFDSDTYYRIESRVRNKYLSDEGGTVSYYDYQARDKFLWSAVKNENGTISFKNKATGNFLKTSVDGTKMLAEDYDDRGLCDWDITSICDNVFAVKNTRTKKYMNTETGSGYPQCNSIRVPDKYDYWFSHWVITDVSTPVESVKDYFKDVNKADYTENMISVVTPKYYSDIEGDTLIRVCAPGAEYIEAVSLTPVGEFGTFETVAVFSVDEDGFGMFNFPADEFPHGPITIKMTATGMPKVDICGLMLYNKGGVPFKEGADSHPMPKAAEGLTLTYCDDFDNPDLSIGDGDSRCKYYTHTPTWADYSGIPFTNFDSGEKCPFSQVDTYLRIRADEILNSSGLISSLTSSNTGNAWKPPFYMECRFICQNAIGTWPAFWTLSTNETTGPNKKQHDEMDMIEAYGVKDFSHKNHYGFYTGYGMWGSDERYGGSTFTDTRNISSGGTFDTDFHTYAIYVGMEETVFYYDNVEILRGKTLPLTRDTDLTYFMINLAVGGSSGWPTDLSRYDYKADMYVDWVRVYSLPENYIQL